MIDQEITEPALLAGLLDVALKLRYENRHMREMLARMGIEPKFPEYRDYRQERKAA